MILSIAARDPNHGEAAPASNASVTEEERRQEIREIKALLEELQMGARRQLEAMERLRRQVAELDSGSQPGQAVGDGDSALGQEG